MHQTYSRTDTFNVPYNPHSKQNALYEDEQQAQRRSFQNGFNRPHPIKRRQYLPFNAAIYIYIYILLV